MTRPCTFFMLLKASAQWRELSQDSQRAVFNDVLTMVFNGYPDLRMSRFCASGFHGRCTDVIVWEALDVTQYRAAVDALWERDFLGAPLFEIVDVIAGVEDEDTLDSDLITHELAML
jgi:Darcynin, domain of unknown function